MSWLAILLALAALGGGSPRVEDPPRGKRCEASASKKCPPAKKKKPKPKKKAKPKAPVRGESPRGDSPRHEPPRGEAPRDDAPVAGPTPAATVSPGATVTPTPSATPLAYPSRTGVDLTEWTIRSSYRTLAAGRVVFNASNLGEDDHNLSVRASGREFGVVDVGPGGIGRLEVQLPPGTYTLYCSLLGHEEAGMLLDITVR